MGIAYQEKTIARSHEDSNTMRDALASRAFEPYTAGMEQKLGVIFAARAEAEASIASARLGFFEAGDSRYVSNEAPLELVVAGSGKAFAAWAACQLARTCRAIICLGTSGGLGKQPIGSLHVASTFFEHDTDVTATGEFREDQRGEFFGAASDTLVERAIGALRASGIVAGRAKAASGDRFISDAESARALSLLGADIVDMECAAIAKLARYRLRMPFLALRWTSDNADHEARGAWPERVGKASTDLARCLEALAQDGEFVKEALA